MIFEKYLQLRSCAYYKKKLPIESCLQNIQTFKSPFSESKHSNFEERIVIKYESATNL